MPNWEQGDMYDFVDVCPVCGWDSCQEPCKLPECPACGTKMGKAEMERTITPGIYRHFKGNCYRVDCIATHTETGESMVVYQALYGERRMFVRPLELFAGPVDREKYPDVDQKYRFELLEGTGATQAWAGLIRKRFEQVR